MLKQYQDKYACTKKLDELLLSVTPVHVPGLCTIKSIVCCCLCTHWAATRWSLCRRWRVGEAATGCTSWSSSPGMCSGWSPPGTLQEGERGIIYGVFLHEEHTFPVVTSACDSMFDRVQKHIYNKENDSRIQLLIFNVVWTLFHQTFES